MSHAQPSGLNLLGAITAGDPILVERLIGQALIESALERQALRRDAPAPDAAKRATLRM